MASVEVMDNLENMVALPGVIATSKADIVLSPASDASESAAAPASPVVTASESAAAPEQRDSEERQLLQERRKHNYGWQLPVAVACVLLGIMVGLQYRAQSGMDTIQVDDRRKLLELVRTMEGERNKMSNELNEVRARMVELEESSGKREQVSKQLQDQLTRSRIEAGLTGMKGPGVIVSMADSPRTPPPGGDPYFYIVHDVDLQALVNELWAAGAEAVSLNEQRIVARSSIRCVGPTVLVNGVRLAAPYTVKGIGPSDLETALRMPGGFLYSMAPLIANGGEVKVNKSEEITVPPYEGSMSFRYGQSFEKTIEPTSTPEAAGSAK